MSNPKPSIQLPILLALHAAGPIGLTLDDLTDLIPGTSDAIPALEAKGLIGHPVTTQRVWIIEAKGRAYLALRKTVKP